MRVRGGQVAKKNNWNPDPGDYYAVAQREIQIERTDPGPGYRHVVTVAQLRRFIEILPDWDELAIGLEAISLYRGNPEWLGLSNPGVVVITAWDRDLWWWVGNDWIAQNAELIDRLGVEIVDVPGAPAVQVRWTEAQARAYLLTDVLVHELGHHRDRMTTRGDRAPRGEPYAEQYARRVRVEIWPDYARLFEI